MSSPARGLTPLEISSLSAVAFRRYQQGLPITDASPPVVSSIAISSSNGVQQQQVSPTPHSKVGSLDKEKSAERGGKDEDVQMKAVEVEVPAEVEASREPSPDSTSTALAALHFQKKKTTAPLFERPASPSENGDGSLEVDTEMELGLVDADEVERDAQALTISSIISSLLTDGSKGNGVSGQSEKKKDSKKRKGDFEMLEVDQLELDELVDDEDELSELSELGDNLESASPLASTSALPIPARLTSKKPISNTSSSHSTPIAKKASRSTPAAEDSQIGSIPLPHYSVTYTTPNNKDNPHVIRINEGITDGYKSRWPTLGHVDSNWHDEIPIGEGRALGWQISLGKELAERLGLKRVTAGGKEEHFILADWPANYVFTIHHTANGKGPGKDRTDPYLYGSLAAAKFRTVNEFAPHLVWMLSNGPGNPIACRCKYCAKKTQGEVNRELAGITLAAKPKPKGREASGTPDIRAAKRAKATRTASPVLERKQIVAPSVKRKEALVSKIGKDEAPKVKEIVKKKVIPPPPPEVYEPTYNGVYVDPMQESDLEGGARYRQGELVWADLPTPFTDTTPEGPGSERSDIEIDRWPGIILSRTLTTSKATRLTNDIPPRGVAPKLDIEKTFVYTIRLLACAKELEMTEDQVHAWLSLPSPNAMWTDQRYMKATASVKLVWDGTKCLRPDFDVFKGIQDAMTTFAFTLQIAAHIVAFYSLPDSYNIKPSHIVAGAANLDLVEQAGMKRHIEAKHYQSYWCGAEHMYSNEVVRLIEDDKQLPVEDYPRSESTKKCALFLHISGLYRKDNKAARVIGQIYELVDLIAEAEKQGESVSGGAGGESAMVMFETPSARKERLRKEDSGVRDFLPPPPAGYAFRLLTKEGQSIHLDIEKIAGRYYRLPAIHDVPHLIRKDLAGDGEDNLDLSEEEMSEEMKIKARMYILAGLLPGGACFMKCSEWKKSRVNAIVAAEEAAERDVIKFFNLPEHSTTAAK